MNFWTNFWNRYVIPLKFWVSPGTNRTIWCVEDCLQIQGGIFRMVSHAFRVDECPCNLHETNGGHLATIHQLIWCGLVRWHSNLQLDLGRAPPSHPTGPPNTATTQVVCQFGEMHFWHNPGSVSGIHYWWAGVHVDPAKIQFIRDWPAPTILTELHIFLGLANF